jgi:O-antigen/teichoic acid export membrane protein
LKLVSFGIGGALLFSFTTSTLQAFQKYFVWSSINILTNASRLLLILILGFFIRFNANSAMIVYIILPFFGFFLALLILPTRKILTSQNELSLSKEFFSYNIPVAVFTLIAAFSARLDTFLNATLLSSREVGIYGAANQLIQIVPQLVSALGIVAAPKFASFVSNKDMLVYLKKFQILVSGICVFGLLTIPITVYLIPLIFGQAYQEAITPFIFLFIAMLVFLISVPVQNAVIFYFGRPDIFIWVSLGHLLIIGGLGYYLISNYGILGTSVTVLIGMLFNFIAPSIWLINKIVTNGKRLEKGSL